MEIEKVMFDYNIRPQELRYKNLVTYEGETIEIDGILPFAHIRPLVITEALLFKAGFDAQLPESEKLKVADFVINNDNRMEVLSQVISILSKI